MLGHAEGVRGVALRWHRVKVQVLLTHHSVVLAAHDAQRERHATPAHGHDRRGLRGGPEQPLDGLARKRRDLVAALPEDVHVYHRTGPHVVHPTDFGHAQRQVARERHHRCRRGIAAMPPGLELPPHAHEPDAALALRARREEVRLRLVGAAVVQRDAEVALRGKLAHVHDRAPEERAARRDFLRPHLHLNGGGVARDAHIGAVIRARCPLRRRRALLRRIAEHHVVVVHNLHVRVRGVPCSRRDEALCGFDHQPKHARRRALLLLLPCRCGTGRHGLFPTTHRVPAFRRGAVDRRLLHLDHHLAAAQLDGCARSVPRGI
eukprot:PhM_4_TR14082/c1_g1_i1/m.106981